MSTSTSRIPPGARCVEAVHGTINAPGEPNHGAQASVEVYEACPGDTLTRWLVLRVAPAGEPSRFGWADRPYWCKQATGRNIAKLDAQLPQLRSLIQPLS